MRKTKFLLSLIACLVAAFLAVPVQAQTKTDTTKKAKKTKKKKADKTDTSATK